MEIDPTRLKILELKEEVLTLENGIAVARAKIKKNLIEIRRLGGRISAEVLPPDGGKEQVNPPAGQQ